MQVSSASKRKADSDIGNERDQKIQKKLLTVDEISEKIHSLANLKLPDLLQIHRLDAKFYDRSESLQIAKNYINGVIAQKLDFRNPLDGKFSLLGASGMRGIGKTRLLHEIGAIDFNNQVIPIFISFNGLGMIMSTYLYYLKQTNYAYEESFGKLLLQLCGVPSDLLESHFPFASSLSIFRRILKLNDDEVLLILVDEIGHLDRERNIAEFLISGLMSMMDGHGGKLIFIFSHIKASFLKMQATDSGRKVTLLALPPLPIDTWKYIPHLADASTKHTGLHQLFLSCSGHPRSIFDGIAAACLENSSLLTSPNPAAIIKARQTIIDTCKFNDDCFDMESVILEWFHQTQVERMTLKLWKNSGILHSLNSDKKVKFLFPLLVQNWADDNCETSLGYHLQQLFDYDALLDSCTEKYMEYVMYHYEAVLRIAQGDKQFTLQAFYQSEHLNKSQYGYFVNFENPTTKSLVVNVPKFVDEKSKTVCDPQLILESLQGGRIVVSDYVSEVGTEYLSPFKNPITGALEIAFVQCKFVCSTTDWPKIEEKLEDSMGPFRTDQLFENLKLIPIVYTTVDQKKILQKTYKEGIYFTATDLFHFTQKLGILRLHTQKLGNVLSSQFPILKRASSDLNI